MALQRFSAEQLAYLIDSSTTDSDDDFSDDETVGDFSMDDGNAFVLCGEVLHHALQQLYVLPNPSEMDSMLQDEFSTQSESLPESDLHFSKDLALAGRVSEQNDDGEAAERVNEQLSESEFSYDWCEAVANSYESQLPEFSEPVGLLMRLSQPKISS